MNDKIRELDWNLLRTFMVIIDAGGITAAAERLGLRQPSVSNALRRLESQLGQHLIDRGPHRFVPTPAGRSLYRECVEINGAVLRLDARLNEAGDEIDEHVHLAMASHVDSPLLNDTLAAFHRRHPRATLSISIHSSHEVVERLQHQSVSMAICLIDPATPRLKCDALYREHFGLFCGPPHPLFGREGLQLADLRGHSAVSFATDRFADLLRPVALMRNEAGLNPRIVATSYNLEEVRRLIIAGLGVGPLPLHVARRDVRDGQLWRLPPWDDLPPIDVYVIHNPAMRLNRAEAALLDMLQEQIAQTPLSERTY